VVLVKDLMGFRVGLIGHWLRDMIIVDSLQNDPTNVIFLDMDGVLNNRDFLTESFLRWKRDKKKGIVKDWGIGEGFLYLICEQLVERLNRITLATDAKLVMSSSWRYSWYEDFEGLQDLFKNAGIQGELIGMTPLGVSGGDSRGKQIQRWLDENLKNSKGWQINRFIILDDSSDMEHLMSFLVRTSLHGPMGGLQDKHVKKAISQLLG